MKYKLKNTGKSHKTIEVHISAEKVSAELERIYKEVSAQAVVPGFRKGKVPLDIIRKRFRGESEEKAARNLLSDSLGEALRDSGLDVLGYPEVTDINFDVSNGMSYKASVSIRPQVKLKNYKGLKLKKTKKEVSETDIDNELERLRESGAKYVTKEGGASKGDYAICDLECTIEDKPLESKKNAWLYAGEGSFIPEEVIVGIKSGDERETDRQLPKEYSKKEVAGKTAHFKIKAKEIKRKVLPDIDDEFAKKTGNFKDLKELRDAIRSNMERVNLMQARKELETEALKLLDKSAALDVPEFLIKRHLDSLMASTKERLKREGYTEEQIRDKDADIKNRLEGEAAGQIRSYFILEFIAEKEGIRAEDSDVEDTLKSIASNYGKGLDEIKRHYKEKNLMGDLRQEIKERKTLDFIIDNAEIS